MIVRRNLGTHIGRFTVKNYTVVVFNKMFENKNNQTIDSGKKHKNDYNL